MNNASQIRKGVHIPLGNSEKNELGAIDKSRVAFLMQDQEQYKKYFLIRAKIIILFCCQNPPVLKTKIP